MACRTDFSFLSNLGLQLAVAEKFYVLKAGLDHYRRACAWVTPKSEEQVATSMTKDIATTFDRSTQRGSRPYLCTRDHQHRYRAASTRGRPYLFAHAPMPIPWGAWTPSWAEDGASMGQPCNPRWGPWGAMGQAWARDGADAWVRGLELVTAGVARWSMFEPVAHKLIGHAIADYSTVTGPAYPSRKSRCDARAEGL